MGNNNSRSSGYPTYPSTAYQDASLSRKKTWNGRFGRNKAMYPAEMDYVPGYGQSPYPQAQTMQPRRPRGTPRPQQQQQQQQQYFQPEQYQYMQTPQPPQGFPQPMQSTSRPVIPIVPMSSARPVMPNRMPTPGVPQSQGLYSQQSTTMPMPQPVIPNIPAQQANGVPVVPRMGQQYTLDPMMFPEPQVAGAGSRLTPGIHEQYDSRRRTPTPPTPPYNPLPAPPRDVFEDSPYISLLRELRRPIDESTIRRNIMIPPSQPMNVSMTAGYMTGSRRNHDRKHSRKGSLFNVFGRHRRDDEEDEEPVMQAQPIYAAPMMQQTPGVIPVYNPTPQMTQIGMNGVAVPAPVATPMPVPTPIPARGPTPVPMTMPTHTPARSIIKIDRGNELGGLIHTSPHLVHYNRQSYPSAFHLHEAMKFMGHRPDIAERIRTSRTVEEARAISAANHEHVRPDWERVFLGKMDEVLYEKLMQHPTLRAVLLSTGVADLIVSDMNDAFWGDGPLGQGANELGKALGRVRERMRAEGMGT